MAFFCTRTTL